MTIKYNTGAQISIGSGLAIPESMEEELGQQHGRGVEVSDPVSTASEGGQFRINQDGDLEGSRNRQVRVSAGLSQAQLNVNALSQELRHHQQRLVDLEKSNLNDETKIIEGRKIKNRIRLTQEKIDLEVAIAKSKGEGRYREENQLSEEGLAGLIAEDEAQQMTGRRVEVSRNEDGSISAQAGNGSYEQRALAYLKGKTEQQ